MLHSLERAATSFKEHFGRAPRWFASAPGRVNLIGEFTDFNDGFVLPMALEQRTVVAAAANDSGRITVRSEAADDSVSINGSEPLIREPRGSWSNYVRGVLAGFSSLHPKRIGFDAWVSSDVPIGAGLASSAALEVAFATLVDAIHEVHLDPIAVARLCLRAEQEFAGVPCGIMDQYIAASAREGHALLLDCRSQAAAWLPFADPGITIVIINTHVRHQLATSAYARRCEECREAAALLGVPSLRDATLEGLARAPEGVNQTILRRARHVVGEIARTVEAGECIRRRDWRGLGRLMDASHESLRTDFEASCKELDTVVDIAREIGVAGGVFGCRMSGGGFGGCAVALIESARAAAIVSRIEAQYRARLGSDASVFTSRPGRGAQLLEV